MKQDLFDWAATEESVSKPAPASEPDVEGYTWHWWTPWPIGLTTRDCYMRQISRDRRALEECEKEEREFYAQRIVLFRKAIIEMDSADGAPSKNSVDTAPGVG